MSVYLERYAWPKALFPDYQPSDNLSLIVVIPCFKETDLIGALESLDACEHPGGDVLIIVIVNESEDAANDIKELNNRTLKELNGFKNKYQLLYHSLKLPAKKAGVGLARKIGMDEAVRLFHKVGNDNVIVCYDADCRCDTNYLKAIENTYNNHSINSGIVFYEHQLHGQNHHAIVNYELYLRYYIDALRFAKFSYAYQTLGSCITVRCSIYEKVGGMNTRKAGEDFYFLNKTIPLGGFAEINKTTIRPSDRVSDRVPFGTGKAVNEMIHSHEEYSVYHPNTFEDLKLFFEKVPSFWQDDSWKLPRTIKTFLGDDWEKEIKELRQQVGSKEQFEKRFFHWFDAFKILKFVHFCREEFYQNVAIEEAMDWLSKKALLSKRIKRIAIDTIEIPGPAICLIGN